MSTAIERRTTYRRTDDIYSKAIEDIRDYAIFMMDADGAVTNWNAGAQHILGYTQDEIVGKNAAKFFTVEDRGKLVPEQELETPLPRSVARKTNDGTCAATAHASGLAASSHRCATGSVG